MRFRINIKFLSLLFLLSVLVLTVPFVYAEDNAGTQEEVVVSESSGRTEDALNLEKDTIVSNFFLGDRSLCGLSLQDAKLEVINTMNRLYDTNFVMQSAYRDDFTYGAYASDLGIA